MRRSFVVFAVLLALVGGPAALAQEPTPGTGGSLLAGLGYPELAIRATDDALEAPAEITAGPVLLTLEYAGSGNEFAVVLVKLTEAFGMPELEASLAAPATAEADLPPAWFYGSTVIGSPVAVPDEPARAVVVLEAGDWAVVPYYGGSPPWPRPLTVTGGTGAIPVAGEEPATAVAVAERDFAFAGLERPVPPGPQVWRIANEGGQPHDLGLLRVPGPVTLEQAMAILALEEHAAPLDLGFDPEDIEVAGAVAALSTGQVVWAEFDLEPGAYVAFCFVPDPKTGMPHAAMGMVAVFTVGEGGAATPTTGAPAS